MVQKKKKKAVTLRSRGVDAVPIEPAAMVEIPEAWFLDKLRMSLRTAVRPHLHH